MIFENTYHKMRANANALPLSVCIITFPKIVSEISQLESIGLISLKIRNELTSSHLFLSGRINFKIKCRADVKPISPLHNLGINGAIPIYLISFLHVRSFHSKPGKTYPDVSALLISLYQTDTSVGTLHPLRRAGYDGNKDISAKLWSLFINLSGILVMEFTSAVN